MTTTKAIGNNLETIEAILNSLEGLVYVSDIDTHEMIFMNRYGEAVWGEWSNKKCWQVLQANQSAPCTFCTNHLLRNPDNTPRDLHTWEFRNTVTDRWFECRDQAIPWIDGRIVRLEIAFDITEKRATQEQAKRLEQQQQRLQKLAALENLAAGMAHEINNVMAAILGNAEIALQDIPASHSATDNLRQILRSSMRAKDLVIKVRRVAQHTVTGRSAVDPVEIISNVIDSANATLPANVTIETRIDSPIPTVSAIASELTQATENILTNALHALKDTGGQVTVSMSSVILNDESIATLSLSMAPGTYVRILVIDTGLGIAPGDLPKVFDPFFTTKEFGSNAGLGLSLAQSIARSCDGDITLTSELNKGTSVALYLRAFAQHTYADPAATETKTTPTDRNHYAKIAVVDDDETLAHLMSMWLTRLGHRVATFTRADNALLALGVDQPNFDLLVTDHNMVIMTGLELARLAKQRFPNLPVLILSGYVTDELRQHADQIGIMKVLEKPYTAAELAKEISHALRRPQH